MPYIKVNRRIPIGTKAIDLGNQINNEGELNYAITQVILTVLARTSGTRYKDYNGIIGVLECVKQELYRRRIAPYENQKMAQNGDVF